MMESYTSFGALSTWRTKIRTSGKISSSQLFCVNGGSLASWFSATPLVVSFGINIRCLVDKYLTDWLIDEDIVLIERLIAIHWYCAVLCCAVIRYAMLHCVACCYAVYLYSAGSFYKAVLESYLLVQWLDFLQGRPTHRKFEKSFISLLNKR